MISLFQNHFKASLPLYGSSFSNADLNNCWSPIFDGEKETNAAFCSTKCFTKAFAIRKSEGYIFSVERGCGVPSNSYETGFYGINATLTFCDIKDGILCNRIVPELLPGFQISSEGTDDL